MSKSVVTEKSAGQGEVHISDITGDSSDWRVIAPGLHARVLRTCQATGTWAILYKVEAGTTASSHVHFGSADSYLISGKMEVGGGIQNGGKTVNPGDYIFEPNSNRRHAGTYFPEDTLLLYIHHGPLMYVDEAGNMTSMMDFNVARQIAQESAAAN